jgi:ribosomal protein S18 acetylase RimI-like enzyme
MVAIGEKLAAVSTSHIRALDVQKDLLAVADLIELCFASTMDADGEQYLRQMRRAARDYSFLNWAYGAAERISMPLSGYVWEEEHRIVGNLSLIPLSKQGMRTYFIANVAVHPDFRRRGIARALTVTALDYIRRRHVHNAWLQVRDDNPAAHNLYLSEGFVDRAHRTTWRLTPGSSNCHALQSNDVTITNRFPMDWALQKKWLEANYPAEIAWNLPFNVENLKPAFFLEILRFLSGGPIKHWACRKNGDLLGILSFEPSMATSDNIWLATTPDTENLAITSLLCHIKRRMIAYRAISINYPAGRAESAFRSAGFENHQTLIWMEARSL